MDTNKPFRIAGFTMVPNRIIDQVMPTLSYPARAVLLVVMRQTIGWEGTRAGEGRKRWDWLTVRQIGARAGINSISTVQRALAELVGDPELGQGLILRIQQGQHRGRPKYLYAINLDFTTVPGEGTVKPPTVPGEGTVKISTVPGEGTVKPPTVPGEGTVKPRLYREKVQQNNVVVVRAELEEIGVLPPTLEKAVDWCQKFGLGPDEIRRWYQVARNEPGINNPTGWVLTMLQTGELPPAPPAESAPALPKPAKPQGPPEVVWSRALDELKATIPPATYREIILRLEPVALGDGVLTLRGDRPTIERCIARLNGQIRSAAGFQIDYELELEGGDPIN